MKTKSDCDKFTQIEKGHKLEKIAETIPLKYSWTAEAYRWQDENSESGERVTEFYECTRCGSLYEMVRDKVTNYNSSNCDFTKKYGYYPYSGKLTRQEIVRHASECKGQIDLKDEERISKLRIACKTKAEGNLEDLEAMADEIYPQYSYPEPYEEDYEEDLNPYRVGINMRTK